MFFNSLLSGAVGRSKDWCKPRALLRTRAILGLGVTATQLARSREEERKEVMKNE